MFPALHPPHAVAGALPDLQRRTLVRGCTAVALLGSSALLSACGGGDDETPPDSATPAPPPSPPQPPAVTAPTLIGHAALPADSFVPGPTSGQFISGGDLDRARDTYHYTLPFTNQQPMQGFSAMIPGPVAGTFYVMQDNGFGGRKASPDALQHIYAIRPDWSTGKVLPVHFTTGAVLPAFTPESYIRLRDPQHRIGYPIVADMASYPGLSVSPAGQTIAVDPIITAGRLLTGYDIDPESVVRDRDGNFWVGDEFGPFIFQFNAQGELLSREVPMPNLPRIGSNAWIQSPNNPYLLNGTGANLPNSGGLESMAINTSKTQLYAMYEAAINGDDSRRRVISVFDLRSQAFLPQFYGYRASVGQRINGNGDLETENFSVNDMVAINDKEFLVMEKDSGAGDVRTGLFPASGTWRNAARFKRIYRIHLDQVDANGFLLKQEVADLMHLRDPEGRGGKATIDGIYTHPMECVEVVTIVDATTLAVVNDNNYPGGSPARITSKPDDNEFILIRLPEALPLA